MTDFKVLAETPDTVTLSRADYHALLEELEDAEDRVTVLQDCLEDMKPEASKYLLSLVETMRIIDGANPITVWRERRGVSRGDLADKLRLHDADLAAIEAGAPISASMLYKIASALDVLIDQLKPVTAAP